LKVWESPFKDLLKASTRPSKGLQTAFKELEEALKMP